MTTLSLGQRAFVSAGAAVMAFLNPHRGDLVALLGETTAPSMLLDRLCARMARTPSGAILLAKRPDISVASTGHLRRLPEGSFGREYIDWMDRHSYTPDERTPVRFIADRDHAFIVQRYRQTHDFVHVLTGLPTSVVGEIAQKWFELLQTGFPMCALSALVGPARLSFTDQRHLIVDYLPWAFRCASSSQFLLAVPFEEYFHHDIDAVRSELGIIKAPHY